MALQRSVPLNELLRGLSEPARIDGPGDVPVNGIAIDSREVHRGDVFVALRGDRTDGHRFAAQAAERGAAALVVEEPVTVGAQATIVTVPDCARALSHIAAAFYGFPSQSLAVIGVTGTNGKTTTTHMIATVLTAGGLPCATIGTIGAHFGEHHWELANTTPLAAQLQSLLADLRDRDAHAVAMEVSSHALALHRVDDVRFETAALTNVTRDHLDFHGSFEAYAAAKRRLFEAGEQCVFNIDDPLGRQWSDELRAVKPVTTYALDTPGDVRAENLSLRSDGSTFGVDGQRFDLGLPGRFNVENALCAIAVARQFDISDAETASALSSVQAVRGRMQRLHAPGNFDIFVDYAHTPDALTNVLRTLREAVTGRLIVVFGCGGDRDRGKRPQMGAVAARWADAAYVTSDNPRSEDPMAIIAEIEQGMRGTAHSVFPDRREAIAAAIAAARAGDAVLIAGKGHEQYQIIGQDVLPFDDLRVASDAAGITEPVA